VALGLFNSVVSAFYYVRVLKAMFLREPGAKRLAPADRGIYLPIVLATIVVVIFGVMPDSLMSVMQAAAVPMLTDPARLPPDNPAQAAFKTATKLPPGAVKAQPPVMPPGYAERMKAAQGLTKGGAPATKPAAKTAGKKSAPTKTKPAAAPAGKQSTPAKTKSD
jgi:hypothetical protein